MLARFGSLLLALIVVSGPLLRAQEAGREEPRLSDEEAAAVDAAVESEIERQRLVRAAVGVIRKEAIDFTRPNHPSQIMGQIPGVAVAVTNGEGHTTAIRQPFTTNPVYLFLEDGIPIRSTGFFLVCDPTLSCFGRETGTFSGTLTLP